MKQSFALLARNCLLLHLPETPQEFSKGYIGKEIVDGEGMLFQFREPRLIPIIMEGMKEPLDLLWIYNGSVDTIIERFFGRVVSSVGEAVLELPAGYVEKSGIKRGDPLGLLDGDDGRESIN